MDKKYAFIFAFLLAGLVICTVFLFNFASTRENFSRESVTISRVIDGDTIVLEDGRTIRLLNINSPEKGTIGANLSADFLKRYANKSVEIEITGIDKYKRSLARIYAPEYLNLEIVNLGLASKFLVEDSELSDFSKAENNAVKNNLGIWKKSEFAGCFDSKIDEINEIITLKNKCPNTNVKGWFVKDESRKTYTFANLSLGEIRVHSLSGKDNDTNLFWGSSGNIWNNDRDTLYLFDSEGGIVHHESYGY